MRHRSTAAVAATLAAAVIAAPAAQAQSSDTRSKQAQRRANAALADSRDAKETVLRLRTTITALEAFGNALGTQVQALTREIAGLKGVADAHSAAIERNRQSSAAADAKNAEQDEAIAGLAAQPSGDADEAGQNKRLDDLEDTDETHDGRHDTAEAKNTAQDTAIQGVQDKNTAQDEDITDLETAVAAIQAGLAGLGDRLDTAEDDIDALQAGAAAEEYGVAALFVDGNKVASVWTADIPDDGNNAGQGSGSTVITCAAACTLEVRAAIRTGETDVANEGKAGQIGAGLVITRVADGSVVTGGQTAPNPDYPGTAVQDVDGVPLSSRAPTADTGTELTLAGLETTLEAGQYVVQGSVQAFDFDGGTGGPQE